MSRYDLVLYGATGFTGIRILETLVNSKYCENIHYAIAGRSEKKLRRVLDDISNKTGRDIRYIPIIIASTDDEESLATMAQQAKIIVNAVGPYRLHGEPVVKAAIENGAHHLDVSGEPAFLEKIAAKYGELAQERGVYVVGACGWDSIPCDLGIHFLKRNFDGDLNHVEAVVQLVTGPAGYSFNATTYDTLLLGVTQAGEDDLGKLRRAIMPEKIVKGAVRPPKRAALWKITKPQLTGWALPFPSADHSIVARSQYYDATVRKESAIHVETYIRVSSLLWAVLLANWLSVFFILAQYAPTRKFLQKYPDLTSFYMFKASGPSEEQMAQANFVYWFFGTGYDRKLPMEQQHEGKPTKKMTATCRGPDAGYIATSGCVLSSVLAVLKDADNLPKTGGVYTTAAAFGDTRIYEYLAAFGIRFQIENSLNKSKI